jgi:hypothetical protein
MIFEPIVLCMSIYLSFIYSLLYLLFFAFPIAFEEVRGWNEGLTGTAFIAVMVSWNGLSPFYEYLRIPFVARYLFGFLRIAVPGGSVQACNGKERRNARSQTVPDDARFNVRLPHRCQSLDSSLPKHPSDCAVHLCLYRRLQMGTLDRSLCWRLPVRSGDATGLRLCQLVHC